MISYPVKPRKKARFFGLDNLGCFVPCAAIPRAIQYRFSSSVLLRASTGNACSPRANSALMGMTKDVMVGLRKKAISEIPRQELNMIRCEFHNPDPFRIYLTKGR